MNTSAANGDYATNDRAFDLGGFDARRMQQARELHDEAFPNLDVVEVSLNVPIEGCDEAFYPVWSQTVVAPRGAAEKIATELNLIASMYHPRFAIDDPDGYLSGDPASQPQAEQAAAQQAEQREEATAAKRSGVVKRIMKLFEIAPLGFLQEISHSIEIALLRMNKATAATPVSPETAAQTVVPQNGVAAATDDEDDNDDEYEDDDSEDGAATCADCRAGATAEVEADDAVDRRLASIEDSIARVSGDVAANGARFDELERKVAGAVVEHGAPAGV